MSEMGHTQEYFQQIQADSERFRTEHVALELRSWYRGQRTRMAQSYGFGDFIDAFSQKPEPAPFHQLRNSVLEAIDNLEDMAILSRGRISGNLMSDFLRARLQESVKIFIQNSEKEPK